MEASRSRFVCQSFLIETVLLTILGMYYAATFNKEIDLAVRQKLLLPSLLMSERALNYEAVRERGVMSELLEEDVVRAFVINTEGTIYFSSEQEEEGSDFHLFLSESEQDYFAGDFSSVRMFDFDLSDGNKAISIMAPILHVDRLLGALYLQIDSNRITDKKRDVAFTFLMGALVVVVLTTVLEALFVYRLIVPRVNRTSRVLSCVESSCFTTKVEEYGAHDQIGRLMKQVDVMISNLESAFAEIRAAEKKYRELFLSAREGIFRVSPQGKLLEGNPALADLLGFQSFNEMASCRGEDIFQYFEDEDERKRFWSLSTEAEDFHNHELRIRRRDGRILTVSLSSYKILDEHSNVVAYEGRAIDVSAQKKKDRAEAARRTAEAVMNAQQEMMQTLEKKNRELEHAYEKLKTTQQQLLKSERMAILGMTAGGVAHDLNNILTGITGYPELLLTNIPHDSPLRGPLEAIRTSGNRAVAVVSDMLTLSRGVAGKKENVSLNRLIREYLDSLDFRQAMISHPDVELCVELDENALIAHCSPIHIQKVVMNLATNALEAMSEGGTLRIATSVADVKSGYDEESNITQGFCKLEVSDTGGGIGDKDIEHIFDPFYTRKVMGKSGTGLGLTIVQNVVKQHGGFLELRSDSGGTTFTVFLLMGLEQDGEVEPVTGTADYSGTERILFVDDEYLQRDLGERYLSTLGYRVEAVSSGEEALEHLATQRVDLLVLDMIMAPGISGLETYKKVLEMVPDQKAVIVSGFAPDESVREARDLGLSGFVQKPYSIAQLAQSVREALDG